MLRRDDASERRKELSRGSNLSLKLTGIEDLPRSRALSKFPRNPTVRRPEGAVMASTERSPGLHQSSQKPLSSRRSRDQAPPMHWFNNLRFVP
jgi:hypothetical protein